ncbi:MAG: radical SAM protein [Pseudomonadota bacterium]
MTNADTCKRDPRAPLRQALRTHGEFGAGQTAGRFYPIACVALEITQRCNLDCTLCYLSDRAEMAKDVPLPVLASRIAMIAKRYGPGTSVQITGGDPTLRKVEHLEELCRLIRGHGMRSCLMTNGIKASRKMLARLAAAGLDDVAFHVDLTQERKGYDSEAALNAIRRDYLDRAEGLGLRVLFNTTVFDGNLAELPALVRFFRGEAHRITLISFQMQADTGRGVLGTRGDAITQGSVARRIEEGMGTALDFGATAVGHSACNRFAVALVAGKQAMPALGNRALVHRLIAGLEEIEHQRDGYLDIARSLARLGLRRPRLALAALAEAGRLAWHLRGGIWRGLVRGRPRVARLSVLIHNFMDAEALETARCESCVFMVATENGPLSMCAHNAERDRHIFTPARIETEAGTRWWHAETGEVTAAPAAPQPAEMPMKRLKGRLRAAARRD